MKNLFNHLLEQYKISAIFAIICGMITIIFGITAMMSGILCEETHRGQTIIYVMICFTVIINFALHIESFVSNVRISGRRQDNVLAIIFVEGGYVCFIIQFFVKGYINYANINWELFAIVFAIYIWVNASMLASMPMPFARNCGIVAMMTGLFLYIGGRTWSSVAAVLVGICIIVNGYERVRMSMIGGKK